MNNDVVIPIAKDSLHYTYTKFKDMDLDVDKHNHIFMGMALERMAVGVLKECMSVIDNMADPNDSDRYFWAVQAVGQRVKEHFGLEQ